MGALFLTTLILLASAGADGKDADAPIYASYCVSVKSTQRWSAPADDPMHLPTDVAVDRWNRVYVADGVNRRVICFNSQGEMEFVLAEVADKPLKLPVGLTVDRSDYLWIADSEHHALAKIKLNHEAKPSEGEWIELPADTKGKPCDPTDVEVTLLNTTKPASNRVWVVDNDHHRLLFRDEHSTAWTPFGEPGPSVGQFQWPFMLASTPQGDLYVSEAIGARVQHLTPTLRWSGPFGRWGVQLGQLYRPKGIVADAEGNLYVADSTLRVIQVFAPDGRVRGVLTDEKGHLLRFDFPMGLAFDSQARLYVVELKANCVTQVTLAHPPTTQPASVSEPSTDGEGTR